MQFQRTVAAVACLLLLFTFFGCRSLPEEAGTNTSPGEPISFGGSLYSAEHPVLRLRLDYTVSAARLEVRLYLEYYSLFMGARTGGTLTVNGQQYSFETAPISEGENVPHRYMLFSATDQIAVGEGRVIQLDAVWNYGGYYGTPAAAVDRLTVHGIVSWNGETAGSVGAGSG